LRFDIALGRDRIRFQALESQLFEEDANLRWTAFEPSELFDDLDSLGNRGGWMLSKIVLQRVMVSLHLAGRMMKLKLFEGLNAPCLILFSIAEHGIFTDPDAQRDLMMRQTFRFEQQGFHLPLHARMWVMIPLILQFLDVFLGKRQVQHVPTSSGIAWFSSFLFILP
jgi:hypothetical protein